MKKKIGESPYSKMYLIPPNMYEKLLKCLDVKESRETEDLNADNTGEERPGDKQIEIMNKEAMDSTEPQTDIPEGDVSQENIDNPSNVMEDVSTENIEENVADKEDDWEDIDDPDNLPLAEVQRRRKIKGRLAFNEDPPVKKVFTCKVCLKNFGRSFDLIRHMRTVHRNLKDILANKKMSGKNIPAMLNIEESFDESDGGSGEMITETSPPTKKKLIYDDAQEMEVLDDAPEISQINVSKRNLKQGCKVSSENTDRLIPELYFKPPRNKSLVIPNVKRRMMLVPSVFKKKKPLNKINFKEPSKPTTNFLKNYKTEDLMGFDDWSEKDKKVVKKRGTRTSSEANLKEKPAKWVQADDYYDNWR